MEEELRIQLRQLYFPTYAYVDVSSAVLAYMERCIPLVLFDVIISDVDDQFSVDHFAQEMEGFDSPQAAYDEAILSTDGRLLKRKQGCANHLRNGRVAFYLHYYDPDKPVRWTYGLFRCPSPQLIPALLWKLMPYTPVD